MRSVVIITRTKDRPLMLSRVLETLINQTFQDFIWVIVNDGGSANEVNIIASKAKNNRITVEVTHLSESKGMASGSNLGISKADSEFIVLLDDDDTWHREFLKKTVDFLRAPENIIYAGVVTRSLIVKEKIEDNNIKITNIYPYDSDVNSITLYRIASRYKNFAIHSFLYRRDVLRVIGSYREDLPVLDDWHFNLRFLDEFNIGFIPDYLANYHQRINKTQKYDNSVIFKQNLQHQYHALLCNEWLREDIKNNRMGLGFIVNYCNDVKNTNRKIEQASEMALIYRNIIKLYYKVRFFLTKGNTPIH